MSRRIPVKAARELAKQYNCRQVIVLAWDGETTQVTTYGKSVEDCDQAAQGGNRLKKALGWPEELCNSEPNRVTKLKTEIKRLREQLTLAQQPVGFPFPAINNRNQWVTDHLCGSFEIPPAFCQYCFDQKRYNGSRCSCSPEGMPHSEDCKGWFPGYISYEGLRNKP